MTSPSRSSQRTNGVSAASTKERRSEALDRFERKTDLPLTILALLLIPLVVVPEVVDLDRGVEILLVVTDIVIWLAFVVEYAARLYLAPQKWNFVRREWADLLIAAIPPVQEFGLFRSLRLLRLLRLARLVGVLGRVEHGGRRFLTRHRLNYVLIAAGVLSLASAAVILLVERESRFDHYGDGLWWALTTLTTGVAYTDNVPASPVGKFLAGILMTGGLVLFAILAANVAAFLIERPGAASQGDGDRLDEILRRLEAIEERLKAQSRN